MSSQQPTPNDDFVRTQTAWHAKDVAAVFDHFGCGPRGLKQEEAAARLAQYGPNRLPAAKQRGLWQRFLAQCHNVLIYVLLASALIVFLLGHVVDGSVILGVVLINAIIGVIQEGKAEDAISALSRMLSPSALVLRDGTRTLIAADELVPGDIIFLQSGDKVPADVRLIQSKNLQLQEAVLTGESMPVDKYPALVPDTTALADRRCMLYSGTLVTTGQGSGLVVATGKHTELGRISSMLAQVNKLTTPLLKQMATFSRQLSLVILVIAIATWLIGILVHQFSMTSMFVAAVSVAVAAIPEGLPAIMSITLAIGVQKMASRRAIIRHLPAVETLGSVTVICTDKTGTLTRNEMTVTGLVTAENRHYEVSGTGYDPHGFISLDKTVIELEHQPDVQNLIRAGLLCNDARLLSQQGQWQCQGDPTEGALLTLAAKAGLDASFEQESNPRLDVIPFESIHQFMATLHHDHEGHHFCFLKGAPERILSMCQFQQDGRDLDWTYWHHQLQRLTSSGQRVLAVAMCEFGDHKHDLSFEDVRQGLTLVGLVAMMDPPREDAVTAIKLCQAAGIQIKMITGDHAETASAIARMMGMTDDVISGAEIDRCEDAQLQRLVQDKSVFARATPEHKLRLVKAMQSNDEVVAMTGDGVNDAPALKRADIGTAMGQNGTEVARDAADMVLADDNFASIVDAVEEGRVVYDNLTKAIMFTLPTSAGEALIIIAAILMGTVLPITPVQILWVNMITAVTLALALAFEPGEKNIMQRRPRSRTTPLLTKSLMWRVVSVSVIMMVGSFALFLWHIGAGNSQEYARTVAVNTLVMFEVMYLFSVRFLTEPVLNRQGLLGNRVALLAVSILLLFQLAYTYLAPMQYLFGSSAISLQSWLEIILVASSLLWLVEAEKWLQRRKQQA